MVSRRELKQAARHKLRGHWGQAISLNIIQIILAIIASIGFAFIGGVIFGALIYLFFHTDLTSYHYNNLGFLSHNNIVAGFNNNILNFIITMLVEFVAVGALFTMLDWFRTDNANFSATRGMFSIYTKKYFLATLCLYLIMYIFLSLWSILLLFPAIIKHYSYAQTYFIYKDELNAHPDDRPSYLNCITQSRELMDGHKTQLFLLDLSFIGWGILGIITCGIACIWIIPYYKACQVNFYRSLRGEALT